MPARVLYFFVLLIKKVLYNTDNIFSRLYWVTVFCANGSVRIMATEYFFSAAAMFDIFGFELNVPITSWAFSQFSIKIVEYLWVFFGFS